MALSLNGTSGISGVDGSAGTPALQGSDTNTGISFGTDTVNINTGGTTRATVDSSGRVLVGTGTSRGQFFGGGASSAVQGEVVQGSGNVNLSLTGNGGGASMIFAGTGAASGGDITALSANAEIGYIDFQAADGTNFRRGARIAAVTEGAVTSTSSPSRIVFETAPTGSATPVERMRIGQNGLSYFFSSGSPVIYATSSSAAGTTNAIFQGAHSATSTLTGTTSYVVFTNGNVQNTNNSYGALSDIKLKENIVDANSQWNDLKAIQVRNYNFKEGQTHTQIGLIAQEVELVSPGLVTESPDRDEDGNDLGTVTKSVNYSVLYMKAVKALQEAMERIETLETRLTALEGGAAQ